MTGCSRRMKTVTISHSQERQSPLSKDKEPPGILVEVRTELFQRGVGVTGSRLR